MSEFHKEKADRALEELKEGGANALLLFPGADIGYYTGFAIGPSERLSAALIPVGGEAVFVVNELERELRGQKPWIKEVDVWLEHEDSVEILAANIERLGLESSVIGLAEDAPWGWVNRLKERLPTVHFVDATAFLGRVRMVKSQQELDWMRMACALTDRALEVGFEQLHTGMTERELAGVISAELRRNGGEGGFAGVLFGERAALPHGRPSDRPLQQGDCVLIDMGTKIRGYTSDLTRTVFYGEPTKRQKEIYELVHDANKAACDAIRPGVACEDLDSVARKIIEDGGYGEYFIHRLGHGIGLQGHERPYIVKNNKLELEPGMTFTIEPGIYIVGEIGVRVEDTVVCTTGGCERLTRLGRELTSYPIRD
ncbi:MAG: aminopeptidase P family protein [Candidatus Bathyarchaeota archaeon]|nr:MAG: aminopeptidase P family protein [Candidatus Bathyarchaeota archaeon]